MYLNKEFEGGNKGLLPGISINFIHFHPNNGQIEWVTKNKTKTMTMFWKHKFIFIQYWNFYFCYFFIPRFTIYTNIDKHILKIEFKITSIYIFLYMVAWFEKSKEIILSRGNSKDEALINLIEDLFDLLMVKSHWLTNVIKLVLI